MRMVSFQLLLQQRLTKRWINWRGIKAAKNTDNYRTKLLGLQRPTINERKRTKSRCLNLYELENFSRLTPDDLALLIILFRTLDQNILEFENILHDIHHIGEYIAKLNEKTFILNSLNNEQLFLHQQRLKIMINTLSRSPTPSSLAKEIILCCF